MMYHLRTLYTQSFRITLTPFVLPRLLARSLARVSSLATVIFLTNERNLRPVRKLTLLVTANQNLKTFNAVLIHALLLDQAFAYCPIFPTAGN